MRTLTEQPVTPAMHDAMPGSLMLTMGGVLALVILLAVIVVRLGRYLGFAKPQTRTSRSVTVHASLSLGQKERVVVVDVDNRRMMLGVTADSITMLTELDRPESAEEPVEVAGMRDFSSVIKTVIRGKQS